MKGWLKSSLTVLAGFALPLAALSYELATGQCAAAFFDPLPTPLHVVLVALVATVNVRVWWQLRRSALTPSVALSRANACAIGVALFYAVLFLPLTPVAFVGILVGLGLLPLAPLAALTVALIQRRTLIRLRRAHGQQTGRTWPAVLFGFAVLTALEAPAIITHAGLRMAVFDEPDAQLRGIRLLRIAGDEAALLRACYVRGGHFADIFTVLMSRRRAVSPEQARNVYYRVTGEPFNAVPAPAGIHELAGDRDIGGARVGQRGDGLRLAASRLTGTIEPGAALAYLEWTMRVENTSDRIGEGRMQIALPPGAVVSRVTLWIDGEAREAAFGPRETVRTAYTNIVARQRDPLLVTQSGPDTVLVQLFPIPARGGAMRFRLGITAPLELISPDTAALTLPSFQEQNFTLSERTRHSLHLSSTGPLVRGTPVPGPVVSRDGVYVISGDVAEPAEVRLEIGRDPTIHGSWARDNRSEPAAIVTQHVVRVRDRVAHVVIVIDGSKSMARHRATLVDAIARLPGDLPMTVVVAADELRELAYHPGDRVDEFARDIAAIPFVGGIDNTAALSRAATVAAGHADAAVLWLHGPQYLSPSGVNALDAFAVREDGGIPLFATQLVPGTNALGPVLARSRSVVRLPAAGDLPVALARLFGRWAGTVPAYGLERAVTATPPVAPGIVEADSHLVRLWADETIRDLVAEPGAVRDAAAIALGMRYELVTAVSGAVVLEADEQYADAGLTPAAPAGVPTVPEPQLVALFVVVLFSIAELLRRNRLAARRS